MAENSETVQNDTLFGTVINFDTHVGLGQIRIDSKCDVTHERYLNFHCVNIADGSRNIDIGVKVSFQTHQHPIGGIEAVDIIKLPRSESETIKD